jgi:hypothetical protein
MGKKAEREVKKKRRLLRLLVLGGAIAAAYAVAKRQRPGPCIPAGGPEERVMVKDEENISGLGSLMSALIKQMLQDPTKIDLLNTMNVVVAIEPKEQPETAVSLTFSNGYVIVEGGVVPSPDIHIITDMESLMQMAGMGSGLAALKFMSTPEGKKMIDKVRSGDIKIKGLAAHPAGMLKFSKFLAPSAS